MSANWRDNKRFEIISPHSYIEHYPLLQSSQQNETCTLNVSANLSAHFIL